MALSSEEESSDNPDMDEIEVCSCTGVLPSDDVESVDADDLFTVCVGIEEADPVCIKLQDLLQRGKISKDKIFYKYPSDVLEIMYNPGVFQ